MENTFWPGFFEENPNILWNTMQPQGGTLPYLDWWRSQQGRVMGQYAGDYGRSLLQRQTPKTQFDYLQNYPFLQEWQSLSPQQRGERSVGGAKWNVPMY